MSGIFSITYSPSSSSLYNSHTIFQWRSSSTTLAFPPRASPDHAFSSSSSCLKLTRNGSEEFPRNSLKCNCSSNTPAGPPGENESKNVLDAFFLGKALAEALNERIESTVGELLSTVGRFQAEQQKQVQEFQDEVLERAKQAKEKAAREAMETQGRLTPNSYARKPSSTTSSPSDSVQTPSTTPDITDLLSGVLDED